MNVPTDWTPGAVALGVATTVGIFVALRLRSGRAAGTAMAPAATGGGPGEARAQDLTRQRDALYEQIRALDADPGWRDEDRAVERHRLVLEAARTLQGLAPDAATVPSAETAAPVARGEMKSSGGQSSPWVNTVIGLGAGVFGALLVLGIQDHTEDKPAMDGGAGAMGAGAAGGGGGMGGGAMGATRAGSGAIAAAKAAADAAPEDVRARLAYARALLDADQPQAAFDETQKVIKQDAENADARTLRAVILLQIGDVAMATGLLDKVLAAHPDHVEALGYRGALYLNAGDTEKAIATWERVIVLEPSQEADLRPLIQMAKEGKNPFGPRSVASTAAAPQAPVAPTPSDVSGTIACPTCTNLTGAAVFIYLRAAGQDAGPPAAVTRLSNPTFPLDFRLGPSDSPMGGAFPQDATLTVRVDLDGNPSTHDAGAPEAKVEHVSPGQSGISVSL